MNSFLESGGSKRHRPCDGSPPNGIYAMDFATESPARKRVRCQSPSMVSVTSTYANHTPPPQAKPIPEPSPTPWWHKKPKVPTTPTAMDTDDTQLSCCVCQKFFPADFAKLATEEMPQNALLAYFRPTNASKTTFEVKKEGTANQLKASCCCSYCERPVCSKCRTACQICTENFCTFCITNDYSGDGVARSICSDCVASQSSFDNDMVDS